MARYRSKITDFNLPYLYLAPILEVVPLESRRDLWRQTTGIPGPSYGVICFILYVFVELRLVTNGQTDGHTTTAYAALA